MFPFTDHRQIMLVIIVTFIVSFIFSLISKRIATHVGAIDVPNERKIHSKNMPRLGGLAIYAGFIFGYIFFGETSIQMNSILISSFVIILLGIIDDIKPIKAHYKLLGQIVAACILIFYGNIVLNNVTVFGLDIDFGLLSYPITILFVIGIINAINLIDGLDGLSSGTCLIFFGTVLTITILQGKFNPLTFSLIVIMIGSILGFWVNNFYPAKIFAGDSGSMFMGFMIAVVSLLGFKTATLTSLIVPIIILGIPILDTLCAIIRRILKHQPIFLPDKNHLHHQLLKLGLSHRNTVLAIYAMNIMFAAASIIYITKDRIIGKYVYIAIAILMIFLITKTSVLREKTEKK